MAKRMTTGQILQLKPPTQQIPQLPIPRPKLPTHQTPPLRILQTRIRAQGLTRSTLTSTRRWGNIKRYCFLEVCNSNEAAGRNVRRFFCVVMEGRGNVGRLGSCLLGQTTKHKSQTHESGAKEHLMMNRIFIIVAACLLWSRRFIFLEDKRD